MKKIICVLLSVFVLISVMPVTVFADTPTTISVSTAAELTAACDTINTNGGEYIISLGADITNGDINITNSNAVVTVKGNGYTIDRPNGYTAVNVSGGATVNLGDGESALVIKSGIDNDCQGIVYVLEDSTCNMYDKVTLKDHEGSNSFGGGVTVESGIFHMYGGTIQNCGINGGSVCYGGGVAVYNGGTFIMDNGLITNCYVTTSYDPVTDGVPPYITDPENVICATGAGVFVSSGSTFTMNGGSISHNTASHTKDDFAYGGGIAVVPSDGDNGYTEKYSFGGAMHSLVTINGGSITENSADKGAGIYASEQYYIYASAMGKSNYRKILKEHPGLFINGGEISMNSAAYEGGGVYVDTIIDSSENNGLHRAKVQLDGTTITNNTSGAQGAGVYYDDIVKLWLSGANTIQGNTFTDKANNLNIYQKADTVYPVYVVGDLTGSQIGLSDPTLWDDGITDMDESAVSTDYLTSGYKTYNSANPSSFFTSDHVGWVADFSDVNTNEVRLVRGTVNYYINNSDMAEIYADNDVFTEYIENQVKIGETITPFYKIPELKDNSAYIFKGWYYDRENDNDSNPVVFNKDKYTAGKDIYAHWIKINDVEKDDDDQNVLPEADNNKYGGFDLSGIQIKDSIYDTNFGEHKKPGGMRFLTSLSMDVVNEINNIKPNNIEYGYIASTNEAWINYHISGNRKLLYNSTNTNGVNTKNPENDEDYFGFVKNINCTSKVSSTNGVVNLDHRNYNDYLLYTLVITYENSDESDYSKNVIARPYIKYTDANGLERVAYSEYRGTNVLGGCYTNYKAVSQ